MATCTKCRNQLPSSAMFCGRCGQAIGGGDTTMLDVGGATQIASAALTRAEADSLIEQQVAERHEDVAMATRRLINPIEPQAIVVCLDTSASTADPAANNLTRLEAELRASKVLVGEAAEAAPTCQICFIDFDDYARVVLPWTQVGGAMVPLREALLKLKSSGGTKFNPALKLAAEQFKQAPHGLQSKCLFLTDGWDQSWLPVKYDLLHAIGVEVETFGFAETPGEVNEKALLEIASERDGKKLYRFAGDPDTLTAGMATSLH